MPGQGRLGDKSQVPIDTHGCVACPHPSVGPAIIGSPDVNVNGRPALRVDDRGVHAACCGGNTWTARTGSETVFINHKAAHRIGDQDDHCGGTGRLIEGSPNVIVGQSGGGGGGGGSTAARTVSRGGGASGGTAAASNGSSSGAGGGAASNGVSGTGASGSSAGGAGARGSPDPAGGMGPRGAAISPGTTSPEAAAEAPPEPPPEPDTAFIEIELVGGDGSPIAGQRYALTLPSGETREGQLDGDGRARIAGIAAGMCRVSFPDLDEEAWMKGG